MSFHNLVVFFVSCFFPVWLVVIFFCLSGTPHPGMPQVVLKKTEEAIADSDIVLFMVDARQGVTEADRHYARYSSITERHHYQPLSFFIRASFLCMAS